MNPVNPVLKSASYILVHTPDMVIHNGTTQTVERQHNPDSEYLKAIAGHLREFEQVVSYPPNQVYIGNATPDALRGLQQPWHDKQLAGGRHGAYGEIMPQDEFIALMKLVDAFDLVQLTVEFTDIAREKLAAHPLLNDIAARLTGGEDAATVKSLVEAGAEGLYYDKTLVGCVKKAHDVDPNLSAHVLFENLVAKASGMLALRHLIAKSGVPADAIEYVIECSEEACGDMNQRGGGNFAKAIAEAAGAVNATGADTRGFCAAPVHALIQAAALVKSGIYKKVAVIAGGTTAKLGMNGKDHVKKGLPILEDVLGGFAVLITEDDLVSPVFNTAVVGRHTVGTGSSPQAVITSLVAAPLSANGLKLTDIDKYSVEMQNPDITKPAGAGDVPEANYKMIAALAVMRKELERADINKFIEHHGMPGWAPTQGHIPSGVPYLGHAYMDLTAGSLNKTMIIGKGSLFLGRMTNLFDGVSILLERNPGKAEQALPEAQALPALKKVRIGLTLAGSELGAEELLRGAEKAVRDNEDIEVVLIGPRVTTTLEQLETAEDDMYVKMEELLDSGNISGCVTMHYSFPIGVSTVGRVVTPALGREMLLASTTGTSATNRVEAMVRNAVSGIAVAKALGIKNPTVGVLNLDGARLAERALKELQANGYAIEFSESMRADGGVVMRGNDLLRGDADVMVTDSLTGNILMKVFSSFTTGGAYEAAGYGYGPGIGPGYDRLVLILSRASGAPVVANAIAYAAKLAKGGVLALAKDEYAAAEKAGLGRVIRQAEAPVPEKAEPAAVAKEVVDEEITGIDILELDDAVAVLRAAGIYAESGMGCTGPVVMVAKARAEAAREALRKSGFIGE